MRITLSDECLHTFNKLLSLSPTVYLCGGAILDLIDGKTHSRDLDFVISKVNTDKLEALGYRKNSFKKNSYYMKTPHCIDIRILPNMEADNKRWMAMDAANRDFNICKLYCDAKGRIYDPTGHGLFDLQQRILSLGGNENAKLEACPARIIRAMKYTQRGFLRDDALASALENFTYLNPKKIDHLYAVTHNLLKTSGYGAKQNFLDILKHYNLTKVLFNLDDYCTVEELCAEVSPQPSNLSFFNSSEHKGITQGVEPLECFMAGGMGV